MHLMWFPVLFGFCLCEVLCQGPVKDTIYGSVRGATKTDIDGRTYEEYLGIPFAAPPVDDLRWERPVPPESWKDVRDTTNFTPHCTQFVALGYPFIGLSNETSEDCLYLNVYVPGENREGDNLSVMYYAYGGAYFFGTAAMYPGYDLALTGDVIVVVVNYRVSTLGWLSTEDEAAEGNYGLWDVQFGLEWVRDNIAAFGGDPNSVTIFGQSAGGSITSHMMISPLADELINRGIAISGGSSGFFGVAQPGAIADSTTTLARILDCRRLNGSYEILDCLREKDAQTLDFWGIVEVIAFKQQLPNWMPRVDGVIVAEDPWDAWHNGSAAANKDFLSGATHHDAAGFVLLNFLGYRPDSNRSLCSSEAVLNTSLGFITNHYPGDRQQMIEAIYEQYPLMRDEDLDIRTQATVDALTDWWFRTPAHTELVHHARASTTSSTYFYDFRYDQSFLQHPFDFIQGSHIDDVYSVFGEPFMQEFRDNILGADFNDADLDLRDYVQAYYTNFAKTGDPNNGLAVPVTWEPVTPAATSYLEISQAPVMLNETDDMHDKYRFWNHDFKDIAFPPETKHREYSSSVELLDDEEFEEAIDEAVEIIKSWVQSALQDLPAELENTMEFIDNAVEERKS